MSARSQRQSGSVVVIVAMSMVALLTMTALIFAAGSSYWTRRHMQSLADTAALSGSLSITTICNAPTATAVANAAQAVLASQLPGGSGVITTSGSCLAVGNFTYPGNVTAVITYPYNGDLTKIEVRVSQVTQFQLSSFLGQPVATIQARAVARFLGGTPGYSFALFASNLIDCNGGSSVTVHGSAYAVNGITGSGGCSLVTKSIKDGSNTYYLDFGNMMTWADGQTWTCGRTCADGYQLGGHTASNCGSVGTQFLDAGQAGFNPNPCPGGFAAKLANPRYFDPNSSVPNPPGGLYQAVGQVGCDVAGVPDAVNGYTVILPGCFTTLNVSTQAFQKVKLMPGFYYFGANGGQGLCLGTTGQVLGSDVTLEFVGNASMTTHNCDGSGDCTVSCGFGVGPGPTQLLAAPPTSLLGVSAWCTGTCPSRGLLVYYQNPPPGTGTGQFLDGGAGNNSWLRGSIFWQNGACTWAAAGSSSLTGQLVCRDVHIGGTTLPSFGASLDLTTANLGVPEAALVE